jgi:hypothetical protein
LELRMSTDKPNIQGEGDYESARRYDEATKRFVDEGKVGPAAQRARTDDPAEKAELERAEEAGRARAKEEDRLLDPRSGGRPSAGDAGRVQQEGGRAATQGGDRPDGGGGEGGRGTA